jgi:hypothetical protein
MKGHTSVAVQFYSVMVQEKHAGNSVLLFCCFPHFENCNEVAPHFSSHVSVVLFYG